MRARIIALLLGVLALCTSAIADDAPGRWTALPVDRGGYYTFTMAVDPDETIWVAINDRLCRWDGAAFVEVPRPPKLEHSGACVMVVGNPRRGACALWSTDGHNGVLCVCRLLGTAADFLTELPMPDLFDAHVGTNGDLWVLDDKRLAIFSHGRWNTAETQFDRVNFSLPEVVDDGKRQLIFDHDTLYTLSNEGKIIQARFAAPVEADAVGTRPATAALLGDDRILLTDWRARSHYVFTIEDPTPVAGHDLDAKLAGLAFGPQDVFSMPDGSVWVCANAAAGGNKALWRITPGYEVELLPGSDDVRLVKPRGGPAEGRGNVLAASDGSVWFDAQSGCIARYFQGRTTVYGWKEGFCGGRCRLIQEGKDGRIYAATRETVMVFDPRKPAGPPPAWAADWEEFRTTLQPLLPDGRGGLWAALADHADGFSHWDGKQWQHAPVPNGVRTQELYVDSRGHLLGAIKSDEGENKFGDIAVGRAPVAYGTLEELFEAAAKDGCRWVRLNGRNGNITITADGKIATTSLRKYFDGARWIAYGLGPQWRVDATFESPRHGFLLRSYETFFAPAADGVERVTDFKDAAALWMIGPAGVQPYEQELITRAPEDYVPLKTRGNALFTLSPSGPKPWDGKPFVRTAADANTIVNGRVAFIGPSPRGGYWIESGGAGQVRRLIGSHEFPCDFANTPLFGEIVGSLVIEDAAGNLWMQSGQTAFMRRPPKITFEPLAAPAIVNGVVQAQFAVASPTLDPKGIRLLARFKGRTWQYEPGPRIRLPLPSDGSSADEIEVIAVDPLGGTTAPLTLKLKREAEGDPQSRNALPGRSKSGKP